ncbi:MAG TPA: TonB-dependent receptor [Draconibacterium sp.]|nr:TonB-dependent receptor [Draconibacterium sp.]
MRRFVFFILYLLAGFAVFAQKPSSISDTIILDEVVAFGELRKYQSGAKIEQISASQIGLNQDGNLEELLSRALPIPFKANAGGLSTIRIRGTAPNHTSLNFGGININSLTLGQANMSNVPVYLFDKIGVQFGSASSIHGSGSIGGSVHLGIQNNWVDGFKAEVRAANGSFGEQLYGTKLFWGNGRFESVTRAYYFSKTNDFKFTNPYYRDFENGIFEIEDIQHNAGIENMGLLQELNYRFAKNEFFTFLMWLEKDWQLAQQNMQTNLAQPDLRETYDDKHVRIWADYKNRKNPFKFQLSGGYVYDNSLFNGNSEDTIQIQNIIGEAFVERDYVSNASYKIGAKISHIKPKVYAYSSSLEFENRFDFYASYYHRFLDKITATVNLRQGFVTDFSVPFTPSFGLNYLAVSKDKYIINFTGNIARSYRVPTFNDRFWIPGGNADLKPEKGINYELGSKLSYCNENYSGNVKISAFYMNIDDWILWKNGGAFWFAENVQNVVSKGLEIMTDLKYKMREIETTTGFNYSFTSAQRVESLNNTNALNRQLEYVPLNSFNIFSTSTYKNFQFTFDESYTGKQYTDEEEKNILRAYFLLNFAVTYHLDVIDNNKVRFTGKINNLLNTDYQSSWGYAMPGINYRISLTYNFK